MSHQLSVWRAAQLLGVGRGVLQQHVRDGLLMLNDGYVSSDELLRLYPHIELEESGMLERVTQIRTEAFGKRIRERMLPSQDILAQRVFAQSQELADVRKLLQQYHKLVISLQTSVKDLIQHKPDDVGYRTLDQQIGQGLGQVLATEPVHVLEVMDDMLKVMTSRVTVQPSGHEFTVEGHANLLQAGLHSGLKLIYGCGNGSCGMCKVRVISGEVAKTQHFDYQLSEAEKAQGYTLMCCHTSTSSELALELLEARGPEDIPEQHITTQVRAVTSLAANTKLLHLQTPRTHRFRFLAGQSASLSLDVPGVGQVHATHAMGSCPCDDRNLLFYIQQDETNALSQCLFADGIKSGDQINLLGPTGEFVLAEGHRPLVFAACDMGFAPIKSLIEYALSLDEAPSLSLFWLTMQEGGHFLSNQCRAWSQALDQFDYELITHPDPVLGAKQMAQAMREDLFDIDCDFYLAGPSDFVSAMSSELREAGVPVAQIYSQII